MYVPHFVPTCQQPQAALTDLKEEVVVGRKRRKCYAEKCEVYSVEDDVVDDVLDSRITDGSVGVDKRPSGLWRARVRYQGQHIILGQFESKLEAKKTYDEAVSHLR